MLMCMKIPADVKAAMTEIARKFGRQGGKKSAAILTPEERSARAKKASLAAAKKRTAQRLERERKQSVIGPEVVRGCGVRGGALT
jgi:hypothetical protein